MRLIGTIILLCLLLTVFRSAIVLFVLTFWVLLMWGIVTRPKAIAAIIILNAIAAVVTARPGYALAVVAVMILVMLCAGIRSTSSVSENTNPARKLLAAPIGKIDSEDQHAP